MSVIFWMDTETTGLCDEQDQILTVAVKVVDNDRVVEKFEDRILLKDGVLPSPIALAKINKINPFSEEYSSSAITENAFVEKLSSIASKYKDGDHGRPVIAGYNIAFDIKFLRAAFRRSFKNFYDYFAACQKDAFPLVKFLIANRGLKTSKLNTYGSKKEYSASLEAVAPSFNISFSGEGAHSAMADTEVAEQLYERVLQELKVSDFQQPHTIDLVKAEDVLCLSVIRPNGKDPTTKKEIKDICKKNVFILSNDQETQTLTLMFAEDIVPSSFFDNKTHKIKYNEIINMTDKLSDYDRVSILSQLHLSDKEIKESIKKNKSSIIKDSVDDKVFAIFNELKSSSSLENLKHCVSDVKSRLLTEKNKEALQFLESACQAHGISTQGLLVSPMTDTVKTLSFNSANLTVSVGLHPTGIYMLKITGGSSFRVNLKKKAEVSKFLETNGIKEFSDFVSSLPSPEQFINKKHHLSLVEEFELIYDAALSPGASKIWKDVANGFLARVQKTSEFYRNRFQLIE